MDAKLKNLRTELVDLLTRWGTETITPVPTADYLINILEELTTATACLTCKYYKYIDLESGQCRYNPPVGGLTTAAFPIVEPKAWCGQYEPKAVVNIPDVVYLVQYTYLYKLIIIGIYTDATTAAAIARHYANATVTPIELNRFKDALARGFKPWGLFNKDGECEVLTDWTDLKFSRVPIVVDKFGDQPIKWAYVWDSDREAARAKLIKVWGDN